jgi:putative FmdB family regulatory protein
LPTYEYRCPHCGHQFEVMHAVNGTPPKCERCGRAVRRVFTPVGIIFKGTGWHITDYRKTPAPSDGESKQADKTSSDKASGKGSDKASGDAGKAGAASAGASGKGDGEKSRGGTKSGGAGSKSASRPGGGGAAS